MAKTRFFRVAVEGATASDGRVIERVWLTDIVATFNPETYGPRINMEHIKGFSAEPPFNAYGDVLAVKAEEINLTIAGKVERRMALFAQLDPTDPLVKINRDRQKIYSSIEVAPNFGGTGKFGLVGLAVTDTPASLGTEMLQFSAGQEPVALAYKAMLDARKSAPGNFFTAAEETKFELEPEQAAGSDALTQLTSALKAIFTPGGAANAQGEAGQQAPKPAGSAPPSAPGGDFAAIKASMEAGFSAIQTAMTATAKASDEKFTTLQGEFTAFKTKVESVETLSTRPLGTGGNASGAIATDC